MQGFNVNNTLVEEQRMRVLDYYEKLHPILDDDGTFRVQRSIRRVEGQIYSYEGKLDQRFSIEYDERGKHVRSRTVFADGTVTEW